MVLIIFKGRDFILLKERVKIFLKKDNYEVVKIMCVLENFYLRIIVLEMLIFNVEV